jgi:hypothetical protein
MGAYILTTLKINFENGPGTKKGEIYSVLFVTTFHCKKNENANHELWLPFSYSTPANKLSIISK